MTGDSFTTEIPHREPIGMVIAWNWPYDAGFVRLLQKSCTARNLLFLEITPANLDAVLVDLETSHPSFLTFLDRASDTEARFVPLERWAAHHCRYVFNQSEKAARANDKAAIHYALIRAGLQTPYTIIIPPFLSHPQMPEFDFSFLNGHFAIKPSHGGGSEGVVTNAHLAEQVQSARQQFPGDAYLLQATIHPTHLVGKETWFRVLYCCNKVYPCFWDTNSHIYTPLTLAEISSLGLDALQRITHQIAVAIKLDLFSTEIALTESGKFVVVDYVNDPVDLRLQSEATDGVPDKIVWQVTDSLTEWAARYAIHENPPIIFL